LTEWNEAIRGKKTGLAYRWEEGGCLPTPGQVAKLKRLLGLNGELEAAVAADRLSLCDGATTGDVFSHRTLTDGRHPCEKPVGLMEDVIRAVGGKWRTVVDPFMGSGSTGDACLRIGKAFVGVESDPGHYATALARLQHAAGRSPGQLFAVLGDEST